MYYNQKKAMIKNVTFIILILSIAIIATYNIYYHFINATDIDYSSESLDITFHEKDGSKISLTKPTPVPDSVGLSSSSYTFTIKNNLTKPVNYQIKLVDDLDTMIIDSCEERRLPKELLRIAIKEDNGKNEIYTLSELENGLLEDTTIEALGEKDYAIRIWLITSSTMNIGNDLHYHGIIQVTEEDTKFTIS